MHLLLTREPRFSAMASAKKCTKPGGTSTHSVHLHGGERVYPGRNPDKNDSHTRLIAGQTRTNAEPDKAITNADRKSFSKSSCRHLSRSVGCKLRNLERPIINHNIKRVTAHNQAPRFPDFQSADCLILCD